MFQVVSRGAAAPNKIIKYADVAELAASKTSASGGRFSEFEKAQKQGALQVIFTKQGDYVSSRFAGRGCPKLNNLICRCGGIGRRAGFRFQC